MMLRTPDISFVPERAISQVQQALASKVSRERFGSEIKGCIGGAFLYALPPNDMHQSACCGYRFRVGRQPRYE